MTVSGDRAVPGAIWLSGQSGAGKSTLARGLHQRFLDRGIPNVAILDGEEIRTRLPRQYGHSLEDRSKVLHATIDLAAEELRSGRIAIVATISHQRWMRDLARQRLDPFLEVVLACPTETCANRDIKGHYARAFAGEYDCFVGVTHDYELPARTGKTCLQVDTAELSSNEVLDFVWPDALSLVRGSRRSFQD